MRRVPTACSYNNKTKINLLKNEKRNIISYQTNSSTHRTISNRVPSNCLGNGTIDFRFRKRTNYRSKWEKYYANIGQTFNEDKYFWSRPSAVDYNAAGSGGSNKAATSKEYLQQVQARIDTFLVHNPDVKKSEIPVDLITASGSGLDPHISVQAAKVQVKRIAKIRGIAEGNLEQLILANVETPFLELFGPEKINVLKINIALDELK